MEFSVCFCSISGEPWQWSVGVVWMEIMIVIFLEDDSNCHGFYFLVQVIYLLFGVSYVMGL